jgi:hypothetical protein
MVHFYHECPSFDLILGQIYSFHTCIACNANSTIIHMYTEISSHKSIKQKFCYHVSYICLPTWLNNNPFVVQYAVYNIKAKADQKFHGNITKPVVKCVCDNIQITQRTSSMHYLHSKNWSQFSQPNIQTL